jgi:hypothetical protein
MQEHRTDAGGVEIRTTQCHSIVSVLVFDPQADVKADTVKVVL